MIAQHEDVLGIDFTSQTIPLRPDDEGPVDATLIRRLPERQSHRAVLYIHGFVDYFFQAHLAQVWVDHDYDFYAIDLRKYGRSLRPHQTKNYITDFADYDEEIDESIRIIREDGHDVVVMLGHSTGGLIASLWANRRRGQHLIDALVLNSPFFDLNGTRFERGMLTKIIDRIGRFAPKLPIQNLASNYAKSIHDSNGGEWDFNTDWKSIGPFPVRAGWARAARRAHALLNAGLDIDVPILVCASARSADGSRPGPQHADADCVLNVDHMVIGAARIGRDVTVVRIDGGIHDLSLSPKTVRERFFDAVFAWADINVPA
jgi:alpha-beta hydrolase superfamily lysophospholipase